MSTEKLEIGHVLRAHGIRGWLRIRASSDALLSLKRLFIDGKEYAIEQVQTEKDDFLVKLAGVNDRNHSELLRGRKVAIFRSELPPPAEDEIYVADLVGCRVFDKNGRDLGEVRHSFPSGAHEVLEVRGSQTFLLPLVGPMIVELDVANRKIICDPPEGLINLDEAESER